MSVEPNDDKNMPYQNLWHKTNLGQKENCSLKSMYWKKRKTESKLSNYLSQEDRKMQINLFSKQKEENKIAEIDEKKQAFNKKKNTLV